ncbi:MAG TPA: 4Fe-4S binding protein [Candidatus Avichristensenella intestinipullorum]|uniref:4Fe-4S binding protein n=1 Tax=Candidatus Avichristensenella intestinipullorum TaxID=2840693 RepID=A0A9D0YXE2_9FIRM|nr:4Fe-4S binding protein [Candidatus Avichristensenella intestinipullorum]
MRTNLAEQAAAFARRMESYKARVMVCAGTGCVANGSMEVFHRFEEVVADQGLSISVQLDRRESDYVLSRSGCQGFCQMGPLVTLYPQGIFYTRVKPEDVEEIVDKTLLQGEIIERLTYQDAQTREHVALVHEVPFYKRQHRAVLAACGHMDALDIQEYIAGGGYAMAERACTQMSDAQICQEILRSGLRGRGGGGFPTGRKWELTRVQPGPKKYIICNGDEGDPGAFMDRSVMEGNPHSVLEGMTIAAMAIGADEGYVYVRTEYPLAVERIRRAVEDARALGLLGQDIFGSGKAFDIHVMEGAGAFVCGEETALMASIEGRRGMPNPKPPYPAQRGLFGKPTCINNVETLASVPMILAMGPDAYARLGTETSKGTKTFALTGHVVNTGLIEVPFGTTLRQIVDDIGEGVTDDDGTVRLSAFKAVQIGGPSGGCLNREHLDMPLDYENLQKVGAMVGSGGLVVMNEQTCMVQIARFFMQFTQNESCGKCVVCREGTKQMLALLDDIIEGRADETTIPLLEELAEAIRLGSLCGLGKTAPNPVLSTLKYFRDEYDAHVYKKYCPAGRCQALARYTILAEACKKCGLCARKCPVGAISGDRNTGFAIHPDKCIRCGACVAACRFAAIEKK